jgi:predicted MFS family arabinose efflux permease
MTIKSQLFDQKSVQFSVLFFALFIDMLGFGIVMPILPRYAECLGASSFQIGLFVSIFSMAQLLMLPFWGHLSDKIGRKPILMISMMGTAIGYVTMGLAGSMGVMLIGRAIDGASGGNMGVIQASVSDMTVPEERSKMMGRLGAAYGLGFIFGPVLGGWASHRYGFAMPMFITAGLSFFNVLLLLFFLPEPTKGKVRKTEQKTSLLMLWKHVDRKNYMAAVLAFFFFLLGFSMVMTLLALFFYHRYGVNELQAGYVYATLGIVAIIVEGGLFGVLSKKWGDRRLARAGAFLLVIAAFFLPLTMSIMIAVGVCVMFALGDSLLTPALPAIVSRSAQEEWHGAAFGFYQSAGCLGRCFGPLIAGLSLAVNLQGPHYALTSFWIASGFLLLSFFFSTRLPS